MFERAFSFCRRLVGMADEAATATTATEEERRVWVRFPADLVTSLQFSEGPTDGALSARVRDISRGGINLLVNRPFETGELLSIELPRGGDQTPHNVLACIVRVRPEAAGDWALGCVFSRELSDDDLAGFGARRVRHEAADQRVWMRFPVRVSACFHRVAGDEGEPVPAEVLNISASGLGLLVRGQIDTGTLLSVELQPISGKPPRTMLACVVHVVQRGSEEFALGCNFIRELSEDDLQALL